MVGSRGGPVPSAIGVMTLAMHRPAGARNRTAAGADEGSMAVTIPPVFDGGPWRRAPARPVPVTALQCARLAVLPHLLVSVVTQGGERAAGSGAGEAVVARALAVLRLRRSRRRVREIGQGGARRICAEGHVRRARRRGRVTGSETVRRVSEGRTRVREMETTLAAAVCSGARRPENGSAPPPESRLTIGENSHDIMIAGSPDRRIAGSPDRRIAGSPDRRIAQPASALRA